MSQILIVITIVFGSIINLLATPWSSTNLVLERRRNSVLTILLVTILGFITLWTVSLGIRGISENYTAQDWVTILLPLVLASPFIMDTLTALVRQIEMYHWVRNACTKTLPIAWLFRTMTVTDDDIDGEWLRSMDWAPWEYSIREKNMLTSPRFWECTSRTSSIFCLFQNWMNVVTSATKHVWKDFSNNQSDKSISNFIRNMFSFIILIPLCITSGIAMILSLPEFLILVLYDYCWWTVFAFKGIIVPRYDTFSIGKDEMQQIFKSSVTIRKRLTKMSSFNDEQLDQDQLLNQIMSTLLTTASVFENSFRKAYLVTPVYKHMISNRSTLREKYLDIGCDLDWLIRQVRALLEKEHTTGLLSITDSTSGTIEAALHDTIEAIVTVTIFFPTGVLYKITSKIAQIEADIEKRIMEDPSLTGELRTRERVIYIDARNAIFWILWVIAAQKWESTDDLVLNTCSSETNESDFFNQFNILSNEDIELCYIAATFLSRCRYCSRYGFDDSLYYHEVREMGIRHGVKRVENYFFSLSNSLESQRSFSFLGWTSKEYSLDWKGSTQYPSDLSCTWISLDSGKQTSCSVSIAP